MVSSSTTASLTTASPRLPAKSPAPAGRVRRSLGCAMEPRSSGRGRAHERGFQQETPPLRGLHAQIHGRGAQSGIQRTTMTTRVFRRQHGAAGPEAFAGGHRARPDRDRCGLQDRAWWTSPGWWWTAGANTERLLQRLRGFACQCLSLQKALEPADLSYNAHHQPPNCLRTSCLGKR